MRCKPPNIPSQQFFIQQACIWVASICGKNPSRILCGVRDSIHSGALVLQSLLTQIDGIFIIQAEFGLPYPMGRSRLIVASDIPELRPGCSRLPQNLAERAGAFVKCVNGCLLSVAGCRSLIFRLPQIWRRDAQS